MHDSLFLYVPLTLFSGGTFIELFFTPGQGYLAFDQVAFPVQFGGNAGMAFLLGR